MTKLDRCWKNCLRMWKWVSENWEPGINVGDMKTEWLEDHRFTREIYSGCFFCDYAFDELDKVRPCKGKRLAWPECDFCPAALVNPRFWCFNKSYSFHDDPKAFYRKLLKLDAIRKSGK